jgi:ribosomal protein S18 acetylase RimI-like enzyme
VRYAIERVGAGAAWADCDACAAIHLEEISSGFLSTLGRPVLRELYAGLAGSPRAVLLVARDPKEGIVGLICGAEDTRAVYRDVVASRGVRLACRLIPRLLSVRRAIGMAETLFYPSRPLPRRLPKAEILNFCVLHGHAGRGLGQKLFDTLTREMAERGVQELRIVTGVEQHAAQRFYRRAGAEYAFDLQVHRGSPERAFVYRIEAPSGALARTGEPS